jgi:AcrR family transcriptional regulator
MSPRNPLSNERARLAASEAILNAAEEIISRDGLHSARTEDIARKAGVSKGLVFNYYKSRDELFEAVVRRQLARIFEIWENDPPQGRGADRLRAIAGIALGHVVEHLAAYRLLLSLMLQPDAATTVQKAAMSLKPRINRYYAMLHETFEALGSDDPVTDALLFQAGINGIAQQIALQPELLRTPKLFPLDRLRDRLTSAFSAAPKPNSKKKRTVAEPALPRRKK